MTVFSLFSGEAETDRQLELYAKGLEDLMNKYENKAAADAELSQKNIGSSNLLIRGRAFTTRADFAWLRRLRLYRPFLRHHPYGRFLLCGRGGNRRRPFAL